MKLITSTFLKFNEYYLYITKILLLKNLQITKPIPPFITRQKAFNYYIIN